MKHFLAVSDLSSGEVQELLDLAVELKKEYFDKGNRPLFRGKVLGMIFQKPSLRTRVSFDMAMRHMGGDALYLSPSEIGLGQRESIADVARVLSGYVQGLMARVFAHSDVVELARWSSIPVVNGLSDHNHPCQAMADALTIQERFGRQKRLTVAFVGDGNNVALSLMQVCVKLGWNFTLACPEGYDLDHEAVELAGRCRLGERQHACIPTGSAHGRSRCPGHLHRHVDQHGPGAGSRQTQARLPAVSGECGIGG